MAKVLNQPPQETDIITRLEQSLWCHRIRQTWKYTQTLKSVKVKGCNASLLCTMRQFGWIEKIIRHNCWNLKFNIIFRFKHTFSWLSCKLHFFIPPCIFSCVTQQNLQMWEMSNNVILFTLWFIAAIYSPKIMLELTFQGWCYIFSLM